MIAYENDVLTIRKNIRKCLFLNLKEKRLGC